MKSALFAVAALFGLTNGYAIQSSYSRKRVTETRQHLEKVYGKGLVGMFNKEGAMTHSILRKARTRPHQTWMEVGGLQIDAEMGSAWFYGFVQGMQYTGMEAGFEEEPVSNCFFALYGLTDTMDMSLFTLKNIMGNSGEIQWFNVIGYNNIHMLGDLTVVYEYCSGYSYFEQMTALASGDYGFLAERLSRQVTYFMTELPAMMEEKRKWGEQQIGGEPEEEAPREEADDETDPWDEDPWANEENWSTEFQFDWSDQTEEDVIEYIPANLLESGKILGEVWSQMVGVSILPLA